MARRVFFVAALCVFFVAASAVRAQDGVGGTGGVMGGASEHFYGDGHDHGHGGGAQGDDPMAGGGSGFVPDHEGETQEEHEALMRMGAHPTDKHHLDVIEEQHRAIHGMGAGPAPGGGHGGVPHHEDEL
jgi:hypothetical protein